MQRRWQVLEQDGDRLVHGLGADEVVVVQGQDSRGGRLTGCGSLSCPSATEGICVIPCPVRSGG
jgi:hypothetical protein